MHSNKRLVVVLLGMTALSSPAAAQEGRKVKVDLMAKVEHDSNVARSSESLARARNLTLDDTIFTPSIGVSALLPLGQQSLFLRGSIGYSFYDKNTRLNRTRADVEGGASRQVGPCQATLSGGYSRGLTEVDDPVLVTTIENIQEAKRVETGLTCARGSGLGIALSASKEWVDNDLATFAQNDSETLSYMAAVTYGRPALGVLSVFVSHETTEYPDRPITSGYDLNSFGATFERKLGARIEGSITAAYTTIDFGNQLPFGDSKQTGATYSASLSYRASSRMRLHGSFDRAVTPSVSLGRSYDISEGYRLGGDYDIGSRLNLSVGGAHIEREAGGGFTVLPLSLTESTTKTIFAALRYKQSERLSFTLSAAHEERTTNAPQFDYTSDRIGITAGATF